MSLSSYNRIDNPILTDTLAVAIIAASSSMLVGLLAFATIGNMAYELNTSVDKVITDGKSYGGVNCYRYFFVTFNINTPIFPGPGLVFVLYSHTLAHMPGAQFWAVSFFFMILCLGLNTQVSTDARDRKFITAIDIAHESILSSKFFPSFPQDF